MRDWVLGTPEGDWVSMAIPSEGWYDVEPGLIYSFPVTVRDGAVQVVEGLSIEEAVRVRMQATEKELREERDAVAHLLG